MSTNMLLTSTVRFDFLFLNVDDLTDLAVERFEMQAETKYENARHYFLKLHESEFDGRAIPDILINRYQKKGFLECQTLDLVKLNQRIQDSHLEVVSMSDKTIQELIENLRAEIPSLYQVCESIALLDMIVSFTHSATSSDYCRPELTDCIGIKSGRHPVREKVCQLLDLKRQYGADLNNSRSTNRSSSRMIYTHHNNPVFRSSPDVI
jgi:DNA mismatch repair ATPase MutS